MIKLFSIEWHYKLWFKHWELGHKFFYLLINNLKIIKITNIFFNKLYLNYIMIYQFSNNQIEKSAIVYQIYQEINN